MTKMNTFGTIKSKLIKKLTESYISDNKSEIKEIVNIIRKDKEFRDLYLFYEDIENKFIEDPETAKLYVEQISSMLTEKKALVEGTCKSLEGKLKDVIVENNEVYDALDQLLDIDSLKNIDKKLIAKKKIVEVITTEKKIDIKESTEFTENETLLHTLLANNFNAYYEVAMNEEEKNELKSILSLSNEELETNINTLKESILNKITTILSESTDDSLIKKLNEVKKQVNETSVSKYNFYKMSQLAKDME